MVVRFSHLVPVETPMAPGQPMLQSVARPKSLTHSVPTPLQPVQDQLRLSTQHANPATLFGSSQPNDDIQFKDVAKAAGKWLKKSYTKAKNKAKTELNKPRSEKKAAIATGAVAFVAAEAATGFSSLGVAGATAASAATGYVLTKKAKQHEQQKQAQH